MSKSLIYAGSNTALATSATGTVIPFSNIVRRYGNDLELSGGNVVVKNSGYYDVDVNLTLQGEAVGQVVIQVYKDGVAVPYATSTVTTAVGDYVSVTVPCTIRQCGCNCACNCSTLTVNVSGEAVNVVNASINVSKE